MQKSLRSIVGLFLFAIGSIAFASTADFKPSGINMPGFTLKQDATVARAIGQTIDTVAVYERAKQSMRQEHERSLKVASEPALDTRPMAFRKPNGDGYIRSGQGIQADSGAKVRQSQRVII